MKNNDFIGNNIFIWRNIWFRAWGKFHDAADQGMIGTQLSYPQLFSNWSEESDLALVSSESGKLSSCPWLKKVLVPAAEYFFKICKKINH